MSWFLIEGQVYPYSIKDAVYGEIRQHLVDLGGVGFSPSPSGYIFEILWFDTKPNVASCLRVRKLGWFERVWRMTYRVVRLTSRLTQAQRRYCQLQLLDIIKNLPQSYQRATSFLRGMSYGQWVHSVDILTKADRSAMTRIQTSWPTMPAIRVCVIGTNFRDIDGDEWVIFVHSCDQLADHALFWFASEILKNPDATMIYADDDEIESGQRCRPRFKPDWSLTHLRAIDYIGRSVVLSGRAIAAAGGVKLANRAGDIWELLLRVGEQSHDRVRHIPAVLLHRDAEAEKKSPVVIRRVFHALPPQAPLVSIIIPTRDSVDLLRTCVESLIVNTTYPRFEIVVVDNGSSNRDALEYLLELERKHHVRVLHYDGPFNYSAINNFAVRHVTCEVLCCLNNDTEVISPDWLEEMVGHLCQKNVGVVGAKLYYPNGRVQHGGVVVGPGGCANHLHAFINENDPGYCHRAKVAQELSAVTAACMVTWRDLYQQLGGFDEKNLPIAFNDVDYCLRVRQAGYKVIWTPHAELYHHESASRGNDKSGKRLKSAKKEVSYMRRQWRKEMQHDPFYNPNFSYLRSDFMLGPAPNVKKPWLSA